MYFPISADEHRSEAMRQVANYLGQCPTEALPHLLAANNEANLLINRTEQHVAINTAAIRESATSLESCLRIKELRSQADLIKKEAVQFMMEFESKKRECSGQALALQTDLNEMKVIATRLVQGREQVLNLETWLKQLAEECVTRKQDAAKALQPLLCHQETLQRRKRAMEQEIEAIKENQRLKENEYRKNISQLEEEVFESEKQLHSLTVDWSHKSESYGGWLGELRSEVKDIQNFIHRANERSAKITPSSDNVNNNPDLEFKIERSPWDLSTGLKDGSSNNIAQDTHYLPDQLRQLDGDFTCIRLNASSLDPSSAAGPQSQNATQKNNHILDSTDVANYCQTALHSTPWRPQWDKPGILYHLSVNGQIDRKESAQRAFSPPDLAFIRNRIASKYEKNTIEDVQHLKKSCVNNTEWETSHKLLHQESGQVMSSPVHCNNNKIPTPDFMSPPTDSMAQQQNPHMMPSSYNYANNMVQQQTQAMSTSSPNMINSLHKQQSNEMVSSPHNTPSKTVIEQNPQILTSPSHITFSQRQSDSPSHNSQHNGQTLTPCSSHNTTPNVLYQQQEDIASFSLHNGTSKMSYQKEEATTLFPSQETIINTSQPDIYSQRQTDDAVWEGSQKRGDESIFFGETQFGDNESAKYFGSSSSKKYDRNQQSTGAAASCELPNPDGFFANNFDEMTLDDFKQDNDEFMKKAKTPKKSKKHKKNRRRSKETIDVSCEEIKDEVIPVESQNAPINANANTKKVTIMMKSTRDDHDENMHGEFPNNHTHNFDWSIPKYENKKSSGGIELWRDVGDESRSRCSDDAVRTFVSGSANNVSDRVVRRTGELSRSSWSIGIEPVDFESDRNNQAVEFKTLDLNELPINEKKKNNRKLNLNFYILKYFIFIFLSIQ
eukprot:GHVL01035403.1.p1 GENE.GHVL01035403.1~~GHVL01035403.1.p1  ORF type:complete len:894 (-),score=148.43 GHVL01035403.1:3061-5742(-)